MFVYIENFLNNENYKGEKTFIKIGEEKSLLQYLIDKLDINFYLKA